MPHKYAYLTPVQNRNHFRFPSLTFSFSLSFFPSLQMFTRHHEKERNSCPTVSRATDAGYKNSGMCKLAKAQAAFETEQFSPTEPEDKSEKHSRIYD
jgi:hypothetical protein